MNNREWLVRQTDEELSRRVASECNLFPLTAKILVNRGLTEKEEIKLEGIELEQDNLANFARHNKNAIIDITIIFVTPKYNPKAAINLISPNPIDSLPYSKHPISFIIKISYSKYHISQFIN